MEGSRAEYSEATCLSSYVILEVERWLTRILQVRENTSEIQSGLRSMKFEVPTEGEEKITKKYEELEKKMQEQFASVADE